MQREEAIPLETPDGYPVTELVRVIDARLHGPAELRITGVNNLEQAEPGDLALLASHRLLDQALHSRASAFIVPQYFPDLNGAQLVSAHPQFDFVRLITQFFTKIPAPAGIAENVVKGSNVRLGRDVSIGAFVAIGSHTILGNRVTLYPGVFLGEGVTIGDDSVLHPNVSIQDGCRIGARVVIHAGTVIGSDGFGYVQHEGRHHKIPQRGVVVIEDDVEIGANVAIDRATFGATHVRQGTKIDNLVQIAHNVTVGEHGIIVAQVGIAGSTTIGKGVMIGGQAGLIDHLTIGDQAMIAAGAGIEKDVEPGARMSGRPAKQSTVFFRSHILMHQLPELKKQISNLEKRLAAIEDKQSLTRKTKKST